MAGLSYHYLPTKGTPRRWPLACTGAGLEPPFRGRQQSGIRHCDRQSRGPDAPRNPDTYPARRRPVVGAFPRPAANPVRAALHHGHHAGRSADRRLQQDHRAESVYHNRGNAWRSKGEFAKAIADYDQSIKFGPPSAFSWQNRGISKRALGDLDGALADINEAIRLDPELPQPLTSRAVIWRAKGDFDRAIADTTEAIRLAKAKAPVNIMTPPGSVLISAYSHRALAYEAKGDLDRAKQDYAAALEGKASDAGSKANQATAKVRLSLLSEVLPPPRNPAESQRSRADAAAPPAPAGAAPSPPVPAQAPVVTSRRVALVIGNGSYAHVRPLPNPSNDARSIAKSLREIGFTVKEGIDLDRTAMQATIRDFLREAARAQIAVVYYAGHGIQVDGRNYLVPIDVQFQAGNRMT
jgi:tetratricopeptide (TPR) repeat protein